jgi:uncharacterized protein
MRWQGRPESDNVEDRRYGDGGYNDGPGYGMPFPGGGGGGFQIPMGEGGLGGGGIVGLLVIVGIALFLGVDPRAILGGGGGGGGMEMPGRQIQMPRGTPPGLASAPGDDTLKHFVAVVLHDTEEVWAKQFREMGRNYIPPKLVLFRGGIQSGCGMASAQMGPFYCPTNRKIYIDLSFYDMLKRRFHAPGEFAQAYVIAHEVGHHIQNSLGTLGKVQQTQAAAGTQKNALQVRVELQADCYAGVWAKNTDRINKSLEPGDIESALKAAEAIGDDAIQKSARGYTVPDSFTHGTSEQRMRWFKKGYSEGTMSACNTFEDRT